MLLLASASAQTLTGTVTNGTINKPASGDDVVVLSLGQGMQESGRTQTDAKGNFTVKLDSATSPHLVRVIHQGVTYHRMAPPGTTSVEVQVYDVSKKVEGISVTADVMRFQAQGSELQGIRLFAVNNASDPPRTQMSDQSFEFYLPDGVDLKVDKQTHLVLTGADRQAIGQVAANMRALRPPDPYKNKGVRYTGEPLRKKVGKTGAGGAAGAK